MDPRARSRPAEIRSLSLQTDVLQGLAGAPGLGSLAAAFPGIVAGNWILSGAAESTGDAGVVDAHLIF